MEHLLLQPGSRDLQQHVEVLSLALVVLGGDGIKRPTEVADEARSGVHEVLLDTGGMVHSVTVPA